MDGTLVDTEPYWIEVEFATSCFSGSGRTSAAELGAVLLEASTTRTSRPSAADRSLQPDELADPLSGFVNDYGLSLVGGCCGTTPAHIRAVAAAVADLNRPERTVIREPSVSSLYTAVPFRQDASLLMIGERTNANGSKAFREAMLAEDWQKCLDIAKDQTRDGAHLLDLCIDYVGRDGVADMNALASRTGDRVDSAEVLLGGAALTRGYVENDLAEIYEGEVHYARDVFEDLHLMDSIMSAKRGEAPDTDSARSAGRGRQGGRAQGPARAVETHCRRTESQGSPRRCRKATTSSCSPSRDPDAPERFRFTFPRQQRGRFLCIADFIRSRELATTTGQVGALPFQLVTMGQPIADFANELFASDSYRDYLEVHGIGVQLSEELPAASRAVHGRLRAAPSRGQVLQRLSPAAGQRNWPALAAAHSAIDIAGAPVSSATRLLAC